MHAVASASAHAPFHASKAGPRRARPPRRPRRDATTRVPVSPRPQRDAAWERAMHSDNPRILGIAYLQHCIFQGRLVRQRCLAVVPGLELGPENKARVTALIEAAAAGVRGTLRALFDLLRELEWEIQLESLRTTHAGKPWIARQPAGDRRASVRFPRRQRPAHPPLLPVTPAA